MCNPILTIDWCIGLRDGLSPTMLRGFSEEPLTSHQSSSHGLNIALFLPGETKYYKANVPYKRP